MSRLSVPVAALALAGTLLGTPAEAVQRAFVASFGADSNVSTNCNVLTPCRTFATAVTVVDPNGEVVALDSIGYGAVTLTRSISLVAAPGAYAGISVPTGNGVTIATPGISVTLRGLTINGVGGTTGVSMTSGARLSIENCVISNFSTSGGSGVFVNTAATVRIVDSLIRDGYWGVFLENGATATISGSKILGNADMGVWAYGSPAGTTTTAAISDTLLAYNHAGAYAGATSPTAIGRVSLTRSTLSNNTFGAFSIGDGAGGTPVLTLTDSMVTGNSSTGIYQQAGGILETVGNNTVRQNGTNTVGTITTVAPM